jgi:hypothetical protein
VDRPESRRGGEDHQVHAAVDEFLIGVEPDEDVLVLDGDPLGLLPQRRLQIADDVPGGIFEGVRHADQLDVPLGGQRLSSRAGAPAAATDEAHLDGVVAAGVDRGLQRELRRGDTCGRHGGRFQKVASICRRGLVHEATPGVRLEDGRR